MNAAKSAGQAHARSAWRRAACRGASAAAAAALTAGLTTVLALALPDTASAQSAHLAGPSAAHAPAGPAERTLASGMRGADVRSLELRLARLKYYPGSTSGYFGAGTLEAVWAFQEVQHLRVTGTVDRQTQWALAHPRWPRPLVPNGGALRVEVDLGHRVLYVYHGNRIVLISHISAGGGYYYCSGGCSYAVTPTGNFHTTWRARGWQESSLGYLYNPVFFYGGYAIHGEPDVPLRPVSHGCVRIPMDVADIFPGLVPRSGIPVYVRR